LLFKCLLSTLTGIKRKILSPNNEKDIFLLQRKRKTVGQLFGQESIYRQKLNPAMHHFNSDKNKEGISENKAKGSTKKQPAKMKRKKRKKKKKKKTREMIKKRRKKKYPVHDLMKKKKV